MANVCKYTRKKTENSGIIACAQVVTKMRREKRKTSFCQKTTTLLFRTEKAHHYSTSTMKTTLCIGKHRPAAADPTA